MRQRLSFAALAVGFSAMAGSAFAQALPTQDSEQVTFQGTAPAGCLIAAAEATFVGNATISNLGPGTADIAITQLVDENGEPVGAEIILTLPATCNQSHTLSLSSQNGALFNPDGAPGGPFRNALPYTVTVAWAGQSQTVSSDAGGLVVSYGDAGAGSVVITIRIPSGGDPLTAGAYADQLIFELGAAA